MGYDPSICEWQPATVTAAQFWGKVGLFAYDNANPLSGITDLVYNGVDNVEGLDFEGCPDLVTFRAPFLTAIETGGYVMIKDGPNLTQVAFPELVSLPTGSSLYLSGSPLTTLSCPKLISCLGTLTITDTSFAVCPSFESLVFTGSLIFANDLRIVDFSGFNALTECAGNLNVQFCPALTTISGLSSLSLIRGDVNFGSSALTSAAVNKVLAMLVAATKDGSTPWNKAAYLAGQTPSAGPTGQGITDKATLIGRGAEVNTD